MESNKASTENTKSRVTRDASHDASRRLARCAYGTALTCLLMLTSLPALAESDKPTLLAWGHKKNQDTATEQTSAATNGQSIPSVQGQNPGQTTQSSGQSAGTQPQPQSPGTAGATTPQTLGTPVNAEPPAVPGAPIITTPTTLVDLNSAKFGKLSIDLQSAQFNETSIDRGNVTATDMDFRQGTLNSLAIDVVGGHFQSFLFDEMTINTAGNLHFDPNILLQQKVLQFTTPAQADVMVTVSQDSLNKFLADPHTLQNLSVTVSKRLGGLASLFGANVGNIGVNLHEAHVVLNKGNKLVIAITADLGMGGVGVPLSFEVDAQLGVKDGWVDVSDTHLMTNGQEISPQLSEMLVKKINSLSSWGHKSDDIQFDFTEIKVVPGKQFTVKGTAQIKRLRLARGKEEGTPAQNGVQPGIPSINVPLAPVPSSAPAIFPPQSSLPRNR